VCWQLDDASKNDESIRLNRNSNKVFVDALPEVESANVGVPTPFVKCVCIQFGDVDISQIDAVFISNAQRMLALPFLTRTPDFNAIVYATEPTVQLGKYVVCGIC
jgi:Cft2 family RNA processing exonuclease